MLGATGKNGQNIFIYYRLLSGEWELIISEQYVSKIITRINRTDNIKSQGFCN